SICSRAVRPSVVSVPLKMRRARAGFGGASGASAAFVASMPKKAKASATSSRMPGEGRRTKFSRERIIPISVTHREAVLTLSLGMFALMEQAFAHDASRVGIRRNWGLRRAGGGSGGPVGLLQHIAKLVREDVVAGNDVARGEHRVAAIEAGDEAARFPHDDDACRHGPGGEARFPRGIKAACGDIGEVQRSSPHAAHACNLVHDDAKLLCKAVMTGAADMG